MNCSWASDGDAHPPAAPDGLLLGLLRIIVVLRNNVRFLRRFGTILVRVVLISHRLIGIVFSLRIVAGVFHRWCIRVVQWLHSYHLIVAHLAVAVRHTHIKLVFRDLKLPFLAYGKNIWMFMIEWPDVIFHLIGPQQILRTKFLVGVHVRDAYRAPEAAQASQAMFLRTARYRFHFFDHGAVGMFFLITRKSGNGEQQREHTHTDEWHLAVHVSLLTQNPQSFTSNHRRAGEGSPRWRGPSLTFPALSTWAWIQHPLWLCRVC